MDQYSQTALDHFAHPRNVGDVEDPDGLAAVRSPHCGDELRLTLRIRRGAVAEARFRAFGCSAAIACASMVTELVRGLRLEEARALGADALDAALGGLPESRRHASVLAAEALRAALADFEARSGATPGETEKRKGGGP